MTPTRNQRLLVAVLIVLSFAVFSMVVHPGLLLDDWFRDGVRAAGRL